MKTGKQKWNRNGVGRNAVIQTCLRKSCPPECRHMSRLESTWYRRSCRQYFLLGVSCSQKNTKNIIYKNIVTCGFSCQYLQWNKTLLHNPDLIYLTVADSFCSKSNSLNKLCEHSQKQVNMSQNISDVTGLHDLKKLVFKFAASHVIYVAANRNPLERVNAIWKELINWLNCSLSWTRLGK